jgi:hypothetical protein
LWQVPATATPGPPPAGGCPLRQRLIAKTPLRLAIDDNRNSHRPETELGLRRIGRPPRGRLAEQLATQAQRSPRKPFLLPPSATKKPRRHCLVERGCNNGQCLLGVLVSGTKVRGGSAVFPLRPWSYASLSAWGPSASSMNRRFRSAMCRACALSNRLRNNFAAVASWPPRSSVPIISR